MDDLTTQERKNTPIYSGVLRYFPRALAEIARVSLRGNEQHNPGKPLHWDRSKSGDELDALTRHLMAAGTLDTDGTRHSAKIAWRALANLEKELEKSDDCTYPDGSAHSYRANPEQGWLVVGRSGNDKAVPE
jgi:hypothetical protein